MTVLPSVGAFGCSVSFVSRVGLLAQMTGISREEIWAVVDLLECRSNVDGERLERLANLERLARQVSGRVRHQEGSSNWLRVPGFTGVSLVEFLLRGPSELETIVRVLEA